jgi:hypothetical protein
MQKIPAAARAALIEALADLLAADYLAAQKELTDASAESRSGQDRDDEQPELRACPPKP